MNVAKSWYNSIQFNEIIVNIVLNELDTRLLALLEANARETTSALARKLGVARSTVQNRLERLERNGIVQGYTVRYTLPYESGLVRAHVMLSADTQKTRAVEAALKKFSEIKALYSVSGQYDMLAVVQAETTARLDEVLDNIRAIEGIEDTNSSVILSTKFER